MNKQLLDAVLTLPLIAAAEMNTSSDSHRRVERLAKELGLNSEQQGKVEAIFDAQKAKMKAIH
jgi:hypothetical protein